MKWTKRILLSLLSLLALLILAVALVLQGQALVPTAAAVKDSDVRRAKEFLKLNDPRGVEGGPQRLVTISEADLNLLLGQAALYSKSGGAQVRLHAGQAHLQVSLTLPLPQFLPLTQRSAWLNIDAQLHETPRLPEFDQVRIGRLPVPAWAANALLRYMLHHVPPQQDVQLAKDLIRQIGFGEQYAQLHYQWQADSMERVMARVWPAPEQQRAKAYHQQLVKLTAAYPANSAVSLARLLPPLFDLARQRSQGDVALMAAENRAAILTLALHAVGKNWALLLPVARTWPPATPLVVTLAGRDDFPQHFLISAALAIEGGGPLSDAIGVYKEVADSRGGSGFSFNDIAADRAGTRLGLLAANNPAKLQQAMGAGLQERDFMPEVADLPEFLSEAEFARRYGSVDSAAYKAQMSDIEARLDQLKLWQP
ncbi:hypothetical protein [Roseateles koreensis]|uniref:Uncharacterized protein n=1 Tax=Roseateles koreensis TaxID=2987526 RepID=A0ABT5KRT5_9BURK|nr:hypothetical protein [Roseateles koreensis]MDC8785628.1 hypothetical protein [Roseateles koreensis]